MSDDNSSVVRQVRASVRAAYIAGQAAIVGVTKWTIEDDMACDVLDRLVNNLDTRAKSTSDAENASKFTPDEIGVLLDIRAGKLVTIPGAFAAQVNAALDGVSPTADVSDEERERALADADTSTLVPVGKPIDNGITS